MSSQEPSDPEDSGIEPLGGEPFGGPGSTIPGLGGALTSGLAGPFGESAFGAGFGAVQGPIDPAELDALLHEDISLYETARKQFEVHGTASGRGAVKPFDRKSPPPDEDPRS